MNDGDAGDDAGDDGGDDDVMMMQQIWQQWHRQQQIWQGMAPAATKLAGMALAHR